MRFRTSTALLIALVAATAAGCGSDDEKGSPLPEQAVVDLESRLDEVERRMTAGGGACADITNDSAPAVDGIIQSLPSDVDPDLRQALEDGFSRLFTLTAEQCDETKGQQTEPEPAMGGPASRRGVPIGPDHRVLSSYRGRDRHGAGRPPALHL